MIYGYIHGCNKQNLTIEASFGKQKWFSKTFPSGKYSISVPCMASTAENKSLSVYVRSGYDVVIFEDEDWDSNQFMNKLNVNSRFISINRLLYR